MSFCPACGTEVSEGAHFCPTCGRDLSIAAGVRGENTSGQGDLAIVPEAVKGWNWGAFVLTWIWGACNSVWLSFLVFIPYFGFVWCFVLGAKGSEWAWRHKKWNSIEHFRSTQEKWNAAGIVLFIVSIIIIVIAIAMW